MATVSEKKQDKSQESHDECWSMWIHARFRSTKRHIEKWAQKLETEKCWDPVFVPHVDNHEDTSRNKTVWYRTLVFYQSLIWCPKWSDENDIELTTELLNEWSNCNKQINLNWNLYPKGTEAYTRYNKERTVIYIDVVWKRSWFTSVGMNVPQKIYFYRGNFFNDKDGREKAASVSKLMVERLNWCYVAWKDIVLRIPDDIPKTKIPIICYTNQNPDAEWDTKWNKNPSWTFITETNNQQRNTNNDTSNNNDEKNNNNDTCDNDTNNNDTNNESIHTNNEPNRRKSARLAEKSARLTEKKEKQLKHVFSTNIGKLLSIQSK